MSLSNVDNPFRITKSNDLTDDQIDRLWVSLGQEDGVTGLARPASRMSMFILGGKGSGKSHLMRYYSHAVRRLRHAREGKGQLQGALEDGYVGVYARCAGLNASRFQGKGQPNDVWNALFAYYFELWVADQTLLIAENLVAESSTPIESEAFIAENACRLFDIEIGPFHTIGELRTYISQIRKQIDYAVNNSAITRTLDVPIILTRGKLYFGLPETICRAVPELKDLTFAYLLDEFENFTIDQQIYINTLIREKDGPTTFKIGARLYGVRSRKTLSGGEENLQGSEYEELRLDERFRNNTQAYRKFALRLISRRLGTSAVTYKSSDSDIEAAQLTRFFEEPDYSWNSTFLASLCSNKGETARPHFRNLRFKLKQAVREELVVGPKSDQDIDYIINSISFPDYPLLEKLATLHLYQRWFRSANVMEAADAAREKVSLYITGSRDEKFDEFVSKHKGDMVAQLLRENGQKQIYAGVETFVKMSEGLPRSLITILKHVYDWSLYNGEEPFRGEKISIKSQQRGVIEAAEWFLEQMIMTGDEGVRIRSAIERVSQLFRVNRFADKPVETSVIAFSTDELQMAPEARGILTRAKDTSLIVNISRGQREKNSEQVNSKLELNAMLAPRWDLPISRRGVMTLSPAEANILFEYERKEEFDALLREFDSKMTAPSFGRAKGFIAQRNQQPDLFE